MNENKYRDLLKLTTMPILIYCSAEILYYVIYFILDYISLYDITAVMAEFSLLFSILTLYFAIPALALIGLLSMTSYYSVKNKSIKPLLNVRLWVTIVIVVISTVCRFEIIGNNF